MKGWILLAASVAAPSSAGSYLWQMVFVSFGGVLVLFEILRGWRRGLARQLARLGALVAAYLAAYFGGPLFGPLARPLLHMPDAILSVAVGVILFLLVYAAMNVLGTMFFKKTSQHDSASARMVFGASGAVLGLFFGALLVWLMVVAVRSLGTLANAQVRQQPALQEVPAPDRALHAVDLRNVSLRRPNDPTPLITSLARLKNSLELGSIGNAVKKADIVPDKAYDTLGKVGKVFSNPESAQRFLTFPGARELAENPKIVALRDDPEIADLIGQGRFGDLLQNQKIVEAANDPELMEQIKNFDLQGALDHALKGE